MELNDYVFILLAKNFNDILYDDGKRIKVDIIYDRKAVDIAEAHWILIYMISETAESLDIGAMRWIKDEVVSVDVRTDNKDVYEIIKKYLYTEFNVRTFDLRIKNEVEVECSDIKPKGVFLKVARITDNNNYEGMSVKCRFGDEYISGVCVMQKGKELYVFTGNCVMILTSVFNLKDLSDRTRGMYRFVADIRGKVIV